MGADCKFTHKNCFNCKWHTPLTKDVVRCNYPIPAWLMIPGQAVSPQLRVRDSVDCLTFEPSDIFTAVRRSVNCIVCPCCKELFKCSECYQKHLLNHCG